MWAEIKHIYMNGRWQNIPMHALRKVPASEIVLHIESVIKCTVPGSWIPICALAAHIPMTEFWFSLGCFFSSLHK